MSEISALDFVDVPAGPYDLGFRWRDHLPVAAREALEEFLPWEELMIRFSAARTVKLPGFAVATTTVSAEDLLAHLDEDDDRHLICLDDLCAALDQSLATHGLRLASEDELEAACGGTIFPWGDELPDGVPWGDQSTFKRHKLPNALGLQLNDNPYQVETVAGAFKLGDGGEAVCGGYTWPVAWLSFCPSYRLAGEWVEDLLSEFLEEARVRPVRR